MISTPKKMAAVVAGSAVLASAAYGVGTQVGDGNATAASKSSNSSSDQRRGPGRPDLSGIAAKLGVSEAKLRAALDDLRPDRPAKGKRGGDIAAALAKELDVSEAKVQEILEKNRPARPPRPNKNRMAAKLAKELGISTAKVRSALADSKQGDRRGPPAIDELAKELGVSEAKLRSALEKTRPKGGPGRAMRIPKGLVTALAKGLDKDASEVRAAFRKVHAAKEKEHTARRNEFAQKLADKLGISVDKVKAALPKGGPGHHGHARPGGPPGPGGPGGPGGFGGPPPGPPPAGGPPPGPPGGP